MDALIVDDDLAFSLGLAQAVQREGCAARTARSLADARRELQQAGPDLLFLDLHLADGSGLALFDELPEPRPEVVLVTTGVMSFYILLRKTWTRTAAQMTASISTAKAVDKIVYGRGNDPHGLRSATGASVWVWSNGTNWMLNYNSNRWIFYDSGSKTISTDTNGIICA